MVRGICIAVVLALYLAACSLPAFGDPGDSGMAGMAGILVLINPFALFILAWWANPLFFIGCVTLALDRLRTSLGFGIAAAILAIGYFAFAILSDEHDLRIGAYFWLASMISLPLASFYLWKLAPVASLAHPTAPASGPAVAPSSSP